MSTRTETERGLTIVRRFDAPRDVVFRAWTDPTWLGWFAGPNSPQDNPITVDLRVGGAWRLLMVEDEERSYVTGGVYREIVRPERLVFSWGAVDGWPRLDPDRPGDTPLITVTLEDRDGGTEMTFRIELADHLTDEEVRGWFEMGIRDGATQTLDRLTPAYLAAVGSTIR